MKNPKKFDDLCLKIIGFGILILIAMHLINKVIDVFILIYYYVVDRFVTIIMSSIIVFSLLLIVKGIQYINGYKKYREIERYIFELEKLLDNDFNWDNKIREINSYIQKSEIVEKK